MADYASLTTIANNDFIYTSTGIVNYIVAIINGIILAAMPILRFFNSPLKDKLKLLTKINVPNWIIRCFFIPLELKKIRKIYNCHRGYKIIAITVFAVIIFNTYKFFIDLNTPAKSTVILYLPTYSWIYVNQNYIETASPFSKKKKIKIEDCEVNKYRSNKILAQKNFSCYLFNNKEGQKYIENSIKDFNNYRNINLILTVISELQLIWFLIVLILNMYFSEKFLKIIEESFREAESYVN